jgi:ABC-type branched-subunit amino acid transport system ATPase component
MARGAPWRALLGPWRRRDGHAGNGQGGPGERRLEHASRLARPGDVSRSVGPILGLHEISLRFGGLQALNAVSLEVDEGEIVGIIGPNGAGKTTLFECISGFYRPNRGRAWYRVPSDLDEPEAGQIVDLIEQPAYRRAWLGIGRTFQSCRLFQNLSVFDALRIAQHRWMTTGPTAGALGTRRSEDDEAQAAQVAAELCEMMGLEPYRQKYCAELSYGTLRLVELACMVAMRPRLLLLDEPSSGISQRETEELAPLLQRLRAATGSTIFIIEHDMPLIMGISDRVYAMAAGEVLMSGTPDEVQGDPRVIESYLGTARYGKMVGADG